MENENCNTNQLTYYELMKVIISLSSDGRYEEAGIMARLAIEKFPERKFGGGVTIIPIENVEKEKDLSNI